MVTTGRWVLLASSGWAPGALLNTLQGAGRPPSQRLKQPLMRTVPRWGNLVLDHPTVEHSWEVLRNASKENYRMGRGGAGGADKGV